MRLKVISSSSKGNCFLFQTSKKEVLVLECGVNISEVKKALNFDLTGIVGAITTHGHGDHFGRAKDFCRAGIDVYVEDQNKDRLSEFKNHRLKFFKEKVGFNLGSFRIKAFPVHHDLPTVGFMIEQPEMGRLVFITDTKFLSFSFEKVNHFLLEVNYSISIMNERLISGSLNGYLRNRIMESHLELEVAKDFLKSNDLSQLNTIILHHLSDSNSDESRFIKEVKELTGKPTYVADKGREFELSINPF
ncbi:MBL fold metallo-hydrolase [Pleomorphovibrio marinus]|uniref:MBL fold metallo-hydrolase n=1 Tax=Pleomorphovibrio marinus TaxID=2164132 RepID=UPI000E0AF15A|nr:MBL fold metallo-hydrolase [Pleomorphovibrio marinus]